MTKPGGRLHHWPGMLVLHAPPATCSSRRAPRVRCSNNPCQVPKLEDANENAHWHPHERRGDAQTSALAVVWDPRVTSTRTTTQPPCPTNQ